jgi:outer membrane receptor for ferrienterochelin and colicins
VYFNFGSSFWLQPKKISLSDLFSDKRECQKLMFLIGTKYSTQTDSLGHYTIENIAQGHYKIQITATGFETLKKNITIPINENHFRF